MVVLGLAGEWVGEGWEEFAVDERDQGVDGVFGEEREWGEEEWVGEGLEGTGLVGKVRRDRGVSCDESEKKQSSQR